MIDSLYGFANRAVCCGLLPALVMQFVPRLRPPRFALTVTLTTVYSGWMGVVSDAEYALLASVFGDNASFLTLVKKTLVDQLVVTVLWNGPLNAMFYAWAGNAFRGGFVAAHGGVAQFLRKVYLPMLLTNWCVWIPVMLGVYAFPLAWQITVSGIACTAWILFCLFIGRPRTRIADREKEAVVRECLHS